MAGQAHWTINQSTELFACFVSNWRRHHKRLRGSHSCLTILFLLGPWLIAAVYIKKKKKRKLDLLCISFWFQRPRSKFGVKMCGSSWMIPNISGTRHNRQIMWIIIENNVQIDGARPNSEIILCYIALLIIWSHAWKTGVSNSLVAVSATPPPFVLWCWLRYDISWLRPRSWWEVTGESCSGDIRVMDADWLRLKSRGLCLCNKRGAAELGHFFLSVSSMEL